MTKNLVLMPDRAAPKAKSARGRDSELAILAAAEAALRTHWLHEIPVAELTRRADVTRTSLLFLFPGGWPDVCATLFIREMNILDDAFLRASALRKVRPGARVFAMLDALFARAQQCGRLYANLRSQMYVWEGDVASACRISWLDACDDLEELLGMGLAAQAQQRRHRGELGELLLRLTMDLATLEGPWLRSIEARQSQLRKSIDAMARDLASRARPATRSGSRRGRST